MQTTDDLPFPVIFHGQHGLLQFFAKKEDMICPKRYLRLYNRTSWWRVVDNDLREYKPSSYRLVRGHGLLGGYYFDGPFILGRRVVFAADVEFQKDLTIDEVWEIYRGFIEKSEDCAEGDVDRFHKVRESFIAAGGKSLAEFDSLYRSFPWGESSDEES